MDISGIKPNERTVEIMHPGTGTPIGVRVQVMSIEDERLKRIKREFSDARFKLDQKNKALKTEDVEANDRRLLFAATLGWEWYHAEGQETPASFDNDEHPEYNQRNFTAVITKLPWFADQLREEIDETKAFFGDSKQN